MPAALVLQPSESNFDFQHAGSSTPTKTLSIASASSSGAFPYSMNSPPPNTVYASPPGYSKQSLDGRGGDRASSSSSAAPQSLSPTQQPQKVRRQRPDTDEIRRVGRIHYQELLNFLRSHLAKDHAGPRSNAREKLTKLSKQQFTELSTDVYDELMRRINNAKQLTSEYQLGRR